VFRRDLSRENTSTAGRARLLQVGVVGHKHLENTAKRMASRREWYPARCAGCDSRRKRQLGVRLRPHSKHLVS
jgi:hypothetical protein